MMKGNVNFITTFNINNIEVIGSIKYNIENVFTEIQYIDSNHEKQVFQKIYNGDVDNKEQMIAEIESLIEEHLDIED